MDALDRKILTELDKNSRTPNTRIAKAIRSSKDVVNYRIAKLQKDGVLTGFYSLPAMGRIGKRFYKLLLKFQSLGTNQEKTLLDSISKDPHTSWVGSCDGNWNAIVTFSVENLQQLNDSVNKISLRYGKFFSRKELLPVTVIRMFNEKYLYPEGKFVFEHKFNLLETPEELDKKDSVIIRQVCDNSRISITDLAKKINLTPEATAKRLKNLIKNGLLGGFKPRINFTKLGYEYFHVFISVKTPKIANDVIEFYKMHPSCVAILEELGYYDMHLEFVVESTQKFREILKELRNRFGDDIREYEPLQIYTEYKINPYPS